MVVERVGVATDSVIQGGHFMFLGVKPRLTHTQEWTRLPRPPRDLRQPEHPRSVGYVTVRHVSGPCVQGLVPAHGAGAVVVERDVVTCAYAEVSRTTTLGFRLVLPQLPGATPEGQLGVT